MKFIVLHVLVFLLLALPAMPQEKKITNSIGMEFVLIPPGKFVVGKFTPPYPIPSDTMKTGRRDLIMWMGDGRKHTREEFEKAKSLAERDYNPGFEVTIDRAFYIGKFEVTQGEWQRVMGSNPSTFQGDTVKDADSHPVENVTWEQAQEFIKKLNKLEKKKCYRLPTEFEWEFAARGGAYDEDIPWKNIMETAQLGGRSTRKVGLKQPNAYGLYDMLGNVWEWVSDKYNGKIFADPRPSRKGRQHVLKGASFAGDVKNATYMTHAAGPGNGWDVGFRIIMIKEK